MAVAAGDASEALEDAARQLAARLGLPLASTPAEAELLLIVSDERVELREARRGGAAPLFVDFIGGAMGYARRMNRFGLLFQAVGYRSGQWSVLDATAGLGRDAFRLAWYGCDVHAVERSGVVFALLEDGLRRALLDAATAERLGGRLRIEQADARQFMDALPAERLFDAVYLDPMFPPRRKSALVKVEMRLLARVVGDDPDAAELFASAMRVARRRVVVKRHRDAAPLIDSPKPSHSLCDKTTRYDVYMKAIA